MKYIIGAYSQLPFSSSNEEMEALLSKQLKPILTKVYGNKDYSLLLRLSPAEFEYFETKHPEINMLISELCKRGQIELLTSSYNDVALPLIPNHEISTQVEKTTTYIRKRFTKRPKGLWCYNQYFSPSVLSIMNLCSLDYIIISGTNNCDSYVYDCPFNMTELGRSTIIIPFDDRLSKETESFYIQK
ncbi:MAG: hypothetical protein HUK24_09420, partial [Sphaerochaetaceae bacterium]|nr:hypothetical protein [Sphaerochaetaceae bacterium]